VLRAEGTWPEGQIAYVPKELLNRAVSNTGDRDVR
jgi:hypothetical protein